MGGIGLFSIQERAEALGGFFEIDSLPDHGSRFVLSVPLGEAISAGENGIDFEDMQGKSLSGKSPSK